ncbi:Bug family tripartite tricarboxylate transporter substrate binding protein [Ramlibacter sp.]|uniref:Bug family tripartite tricarboxylate transporter substrate binding protein n=1 Tax=Ramlibacter sp. TaxID=1917967 RepID=UPI003D146336
MNRRLLSVLFSVLIVCGAPHSPAWAQADDKFPSKPLRMIVAWPAGGGIDSGTRAVAQGLAKRIGQPVVVENRPGASGVIGTEYGARSAPDGYTIMVGNIDAFSINPHVLSVKYDPEKSFEPVAPLGSYPMAVAARSGFQGNTIADAVRMAKADPGKLTFGSQGTGTSGQLGFVLLEQMAGIELLHVPYNGGSPSVAALLANQIDLLILPLFQADLLQKSGKIKILGITSGRRSALFPQYPTIAEQGFPEYNWQQWLGFYLPTGSPPKTRQFIETEINALLQAPDAAPTFRPMGYEKTGGTAAELNAMMLKDSATWGHLVRSRKIRVQETAR